MNTFPYVTMTTMNPLSSFLYLVVVLLIAPWLTLATKFDTGGLSRKSFQDGFVLGTATSASQVEGMANKGGRGPSIWDEFVKIPGVIADNSTAEITVDQYHRYKEDVDIMANLNMDAYRFSISWSRIFPEGAGKVNWKGVAYYNRLIDYLLKKGITPYANLYHYDLPLALEKEYTGWLSRRVVKDFADFAEFCFKTYGDRVKNWMTFNEPRVVAALGYDTGLHAPGRCSKEYGNCTEGNSGTEPYIVAHNLLLSHAAAVQRYREKYQAHSSWLYDVPWGLYKAITYIKERYGNPTVILSENGMGDPGNVTIAEGVHDMNRINFYRSYLIALKKSIDDGANVIGYFAWSLVDNFEWRLGYTITKI